MTVKELRERLTVGTKLTLIQTWGGPCRKLRTVVDVHTTEVGMDGDGIDVANKGLSWLGIPKAVELSETPKGFRITDRYIKHGSSYIEYEWGHHPEGQAIP